MKVSCCRVFVFILLFVCLPLTARDISPEIQKMVAQAFSEKKTDAIEGILKKAQAASVSGEDKKYVGTALASLYEREGKLAEAGEQYRLAALAVSGMRDESLYLDAARCALAVNDSDSAKDIVDTVLLSSFSEPVLTRARVYSAWIQLASGRASESFTLLRSFLENDQFTQYKPSILFTLWWSEGDEKSAQTLQRVYPDSPEAAAIRGEVLVGPAPFWYLMPREGLPSAGNAAQSPVSSDDALPEDGHTAQGSTEPETPESAGAAASSGKVWQQTGFFKNKENAESMAAVLQQRGFSPVVRGETRPSGTVYYAVLVPDDGSTAEKLVKAGFESYRVED